MIILFVVEICSWKELKAVLQSYIFKLVWLSVCLYRLIQYKLISFLIQNSWISKSFKISWSFSCESLPLFLKDFLFQFSLGNDICPKLVLLEQLFLVGCHQKIEFHYKKGVELHLTDQELRQTYQLTLWKKRKHKLQKKLLLFSHAHVYVSVAYFYWRSGVKRGKLQHDRF